MVTNVDGSNAPVQATLAAEPALARRRFIAQLLTAAAAVSVLPSIAEASGRPVFNIVNVPDNGDLSHIPGRSQTEQVLNYALTLEILEADLYRQALNLASGMPLTTPLNVDTSGYHLTIDPGGFSADDAALGFNYLVQFAAVEAAHRDFLISAIQSKGGTPVSPNPAGYTADFGGDLRTILILIREVEETGVRAYLGAAQFINNKYLAQTAASIYSTEARHSAVLNYLLGLSVGPSRRALDSAAVFDEHGDMNFEKYQTPDQIVRAVKPFFA